MSVAIKVENISKAYRLGEIGTGTLSNDLQRWWAKQRGKEDPFLKIGEVNDRATKGNSDVVWSLRDINFEINQGDAVGIIGRNGAGKSTLLKILSRVTSPTTGNISGIGRIASLLEVGTGFHPELTGRENIYLNGAILGMRKKEISRQFDAIVDFSGVERYIDTPVKRYSSGMYVRLAFAVAAHLESEILIVDEVLAVGDADFQKKCLGKMGEVSKGEGRTVLFVSHNMAAVKSLCSTSIILVNGKLQLIDNTDNVISYYLKGDSQQLNQRTFSNEYDKKEFALHSISLNTKHRNFTEPLIENEEIELVTKITIKEGITDHIHFTYVLYNELGEAMFPFSHDGVKLKIGKNHVICTFPKSFFNSGTYYLSFFLTKNFINSVFAERDILSFTIIEGHRALGVWMGREPGYIKPKFEWTLSSNG